MSEPFRAAASTSDARARCKVILRPCGDWSKYRCAMSHAIGSMSHVCTVPSGPSPSAKHNVAYPVNVPSSRTRRAWLVAARSVRMRPCKGPETMRAACLYTAVVSSRRARSSGGSGAEWRSQYVDKAATWASNADAWSRRSPGAAVEASVLSAASLAARATALVGLGATSTASARTAAGAGAPGAAAAGRRASIARLGTTLRRLCAAATAAAAASASACSDAACVTWQDLLQQPAYAPGPRHRSHWMKRTWQW